MLLGFGFGALLPLLFTSVSRNISIVRRGGILGVASSFQVLGNMIGPMTGGLAAGYLGLRVSFLITGLLFFVISFFSLLKLQD
jgi:MFS family permease